VKLGWWSAALPAAVLLCGVCLGETGAPVREAPAREGLAPSAPRFDSERFAEKYDRVNRRPGERTAVGLAVPGSGETGLGSLFSKLLLSLLLVIAAIYAFSFLLRKYLGRTLLQTTGPLKVLAKYSLSSKSSVYIVAALDRFLIIGETPQSLTCLAEYSNSDENRKLREKWGWEFGAPAQRGDLYAPRGAPFAPTLDAHVKDLERELERIREAS